MPYKEVADKDSAPPYVAALDGVRGIAILLVLMAHFGGGRNFSSPLLQFTGQLMVAGWAGVDLFFVLSGYLITGILLRTLADDKYYANFYGRRVLRVFPIYYFTLAVAFAISQMSDMPWRANQYSYFVFANNIFGVLDDQMGYVGPMLTLAAFWSLAVEEQFYLLWPYLLRSAMKHRQTIIALFAGAFVGALAIRILFVSISGYERCAFGLLFSRMDSLAAGGLLALLISRKVLAQVGPGVPFALMTLGIVGFVLLGLVGHSFMWNSSVPMMIFGVDCTALAALGFIWCAVLPNTRIQRLSENRVLRFFGKYSYGIYIYHQVFQAQMMKYLYPALVRITHSPALGAVCYFFLIVAMVTLVAVISYHTFEIRFLRLKRFFPYQARPVPSPSTAGTSVAQEYS